MVFSPCVISFVCPYFNLTFCARVSTFKRKELGKMASFTFQIPSAVRKLRLMDKISAKSKLSSQDIDALNKAIKDSLWKRYKNVS
jgi:hypothetical protein